MTVDFLKNIMMLVALLLTLAVPIWAYIRMGYIGGIYSALYIWLLGFIYFFADGSFSAKIGIVLWLLMGWLFLSIYVFTVCLITWTVIVIIKKLRKAPLKISMKRFGDLTRPERVTLYFMVGYYCLLLMLKVLPY